MGKNTFSSLLDAWDSLTCHLETVVKPQIKHQKKEVEYLLRQLLSIKETRRELVLVGVGRCSDILEMFLTRLLQRPLYLPRGQVKIISEGPFDPVISSEALVICLSGSGITMPTVSYAQRYAKMGAELILVTSNSKGPLVKDAKTCLVIPGLEKCDFAKSKYEYGPDQPVYFKDFHPGPTLFEVSAAVFFDSLISAVQKTLKDREAT